MCCDVYLGTSSMFSRNKVGEIKVIEVEFKLVHSGRLEDEKSYGVLELGVFFQTIFLLLLGAQSRKRVE